MQRNTRKRTQTNAVLKLAGKENKHGGVGVGLEKLHYPHPNQVVGARHFLSFGFFLRDWAPLRNNSIRKLKPPPAFNKRGLKEKVLIKNGESLMSLLCRIFQFIPQLFDRKSFQTGFFFLHLGAASAVAVRCSGCGSFGFIHMNEDPLYI